MQLTSNRHPHMKLHFYIIFSFILLLTSCKRNFQYSVLEVNPTAENLNTKAIIAIKEKSIGDTVKFLIIADTQVSYDELEIFVKHSNAKYSNSEVDFILHAGDFTDYGANFEYNLYGIAIVNRRLFKQLFPFPILAHQVSYTQLLNVICLYYTNPQYT